LKNQRASSPATFTLPTPGSFVKKSYSHEFQRSHDRIGQILLGYRAAKTLFMAAELDLFRLLDHTNDTAERLARKSRASVRAVEILLDALCALGFLQKTKDKYRHTNFSREVLHPDGPRSLAHNLLYQEDLSSSYADLTFTVRNGRPRRNLLDLMRRDPRFVQSYIRGMSEIARRPAQELARSLDLTNVHKMLDVGGGPGSFSAACLERNPGLSATLLDLKETLNVAREFIKNFPHRARLTLKAGNYLKTPLGENTYDLILFSHVTHNESSQDNKNLLRKAYKALRPKGRVVIHDFMVQNHRTAPLFSALFSVHLLTYTESGRAFSEEEYRSWLKETGFRLQQRLVLCPNAPNSSVALVASKPNNGVSP